MHNLLPKEVKKLLQREYLLRILTVGFVLGTFVGIFATIALLPTYYATQTELRFEEGEKDRLTGLLVGEEEGNNPVETLARARNVLALLQAQLYKKQYSTITTEAFDTRPSGITISSVVFDRTARTYVIQGLADNRDALVEFSRRLEASPRFEKISLPISDLARSNDLNFRLTLTLALPDNS